MSPCPHPDPRDLHYIFFFLVGEFAALFSVAGRLEGSRNLWLDYPVSPCVPNQDALSTLEQGGWFRLRA